MPGWEVSVFKRTLHWAPLSDRLIALFQEHTLMTTNNQIRFWHATKLVTPWVYSHAPIKPTATTVEARYHPRQRKHIMHR
jgi:hypothetical protein